MAPIAFGQLSLRSWRIETVRATQMHARWRLPVLMILGGSLSAAPVGSLLAALESGHRGAHRARVFLGCDGASYPPPRPLGGEGRGIGNGK